MLKRRFCYKTLDFFPNSHNRPEQNVLHFADDIFKCIFLNENFEFQEKKSLRGHFKHW